MFAFVLASSPTSPPAQRGCWPNWSFHHPQHRLGTDEIRGRGRHFSDSENVADTETSYGADRGELVFFHHYTWKENGFITNWTVLSVLGLPNNKSDGEEAQSACLS